MYTPSNQIVKSGLAGVDIDPSGLANQVGQNLKEASGIFIDHVKNKYKETNDLYDIQNDELKSLDSVLEGAKGQDYLYLQKSVIESRDKIKSLFKGKKLKETRTPEFQTELYNTKRDLDKKRRSIDTFYDQAKSATESAFNTPSIKKKEWQEYLNQQVQLPPDQRDLDLVGKVNTDPLFFNPYDHTTSILQTLGKADEQVEKETKDLILNYDATYRPDLGKFNSNGEFEFSPSDQLIDKIISSDKRFANAMAGMLPAEQANKLIAEGNTTALNDAIRTQTKEYLKTVQGFGPEFKQTGKTVKSWNYYKPSASETTKKKIDEEVLAIQKNLQNGFAESFDDYRGDHWNGFDFEYDGDGKISAVIGTYVDQDAPKWKKDRTKKEYIPVDPDDENSVRQALNRVKYFSNKDKKQVEAKALEKAPTSTKPKLKGF
jgi:hypothetical protein